MKPFDDFPPYDNAAELNGRLRALGPTLMSMRTCSEVAGDCTMAGCASRCQIYLRANDTDPSTKLQASGAPLVNISVGDYNIGLFQHEDATRKGGGMMIQNHDASNFRWSTVVWPHGTPPSEVDQVHGDARPAVDAAPHVDGFQIFLGAGEARLFLFNATAGF